MSRTADAFEADVDRIIALCLRYSWSEHEIVRELEKLRDRYAPIIELKETLCSTAPMKTAR